MDRHQLNSLSVHSLQHLYLKGNPLCNGYKDTPAYVRYCVVLEFHMLQLTAFVGTCLCLERNCNEELV